MLIDRKQKTTDVSRIARQCADHCSRLRRANESGDRVFRRGKIQSVHISQDTMLRMPKSGRGLTSRPCGDVILPLYQDSKKIPKPKRNASARSTV